MTVIVTVTGSALASDGLVLLLRHFVLLVEIIIVVGQLGIRSRETWINILRTSTLPQCLLLSQASKICLFQWSVLVKSTAYKVSTVW